MDIGHPFCQFHLAFFGFGVIHDQINRRHASDNGHLLGRLPGILESELAKDYAKQYGKEYTNVIYVNYPGDLKQTVIDLDFADDMPDESDDARFKRHNRFLRSLREDTLLIVDNFNVTRDQDAFLDVMLKYRCRIVFTTRSRYENQISLEVISELERFLADGSGANIDQAHLLECRAACEKDVAKAVQLTQEALRLLGDITKENAHFASNLHSNLGALYHNQRGATTKMPTRPETGSWWTDRIWLCFASSVAAVVLGRL